MKVLCISRPLYSRYLRVGEVYTIISETTCQRCGTRWFAPAEVPRSRYRGQPYCGKCREIMPKTPLLHYKACRFVPWNPDQLNITEEEVRILYQPNLHRERERNVSP